MVPQIALIVLIVPIRPSSPPQPTDQSDHSSIYLIRAVAISRLGFMFLSCKHGGNWGR